MKKKGFTLIELLAVLVVLAILALITIPLVIGIIKNAKEKSYERSIEAYGRAVENAVGVYLLNNPNEQPTTIPISSLSINTSGKTVTCDNTNVIINTNGSIRLESCYVEGTDQKYNYDNKKLEKISSNTQTTYKAYSVGDTFTLNGDSYHIIADSGASQDYVVALKDTPLTTSELNTYGEGHLNMYITDSDSDYYQQAYDNNGIGGMVYYSSATCGYDGNDCTYDGCTTSYAQSEIRYVVNSWASNKFTDQLKTVDGYKTRLIKYDELGNLGYEWTTIDTAGTMGYVNNEEVPSWVYNNDYWYWTMSPQDDSSYWVLIINNGGSVDAYFISDNLFYSGYSSRNGGAVRPVINVYKDKLPE